MLIKRMPYRSAISQRVCDISRHVRYLLAGRSGDGSRILMRLAGPPYARRLIQRVMPFGESYKDAAKDIGRQLFTHVRNGCLDHAMPRQIYSHVVLSYAPRYRSRVALGPLFQEDHAAVEATYSGALRIALDTLTMLGVEACFPIYVVVHADRRHMHAHALLGLYAVGVSPCQILDLNASTIRAVARRIDQKHDLARASAGLRARHQLITETESQLNWSSTGASLSCILDDAYFIESETYRNRNRTVAVRDERKSK